MDHFGQVYVSGGFQKGLVCVTCEKYLALVCNVLN